MYKIFLASAFLALAACSGPQEYAGMNVVEVNFQVPADQKGVTRVYASFGKDSENVDVAFPVPGTNEKATFSATKSRGIDAQKVRAELEGKWPDAFKEVAPKLIPSIVEIISGAQ